MSAEFTLNSRAVAIGDPSRGLVTHALPHLRPGNYRLRAEALLPYALRRGEGAPIPIASQHVYAVDAPLAERFAAKYRELAQQRVENAGELASEELERELGVQIGCYELRDVGVPTIHNEYWLDASRVARPSRRGRGFVFRLIVSIFLWFFGTIFAVMAVGCVVQHFVDPDVVWNDDPLRGVIEPSSWAFNSACAIAGGVFALKRRYVLTIVSVLLIIGMTMTMFSLYG
jgi:hypothetical protein